MSRNQLLTPMFVNDADTGLVIAGLRRYNLFTTAFFLGRHRRLLAEFVTLAGARLGDHALDIGCGPGKLVRALGSVTGPTGAAVGVDPSATAVADNNAHDRAAHHRYVVGPAQSLPLSDAEFDVVTCTFVMHHIPESQRGAAIAEMWRVLRPGGRLLLADASPSRRMRAVLSLFLGRGGDPFAAADIRHYAEQVESLGFTELTYTQSRDQTGILTAVKPAANH